MERTPRNHRKDMGMRPEDGRTAVFVRRRHSLWILQFDTGRVPVQGRQAIQRLCIKEEKKGLASNLGSKECLKGFESDAIR